jgi:hypothetical protein
MQRTHFTIKSIQERYHADMKAFKFTPTMETVDFDIHFPIDDPRDFDVVFKKILDSFTLNFGTITEGPPISLSSFDYAHDIIRFNEDRKDICWVLRTQLFYFVLIVTAQMCSHQHIFDGVYLYAKLIKKLDYGPHSKSKNLRLFHKAVAKSLDDYVLGIFGSLTATSDIDLGLQYTGSDINDGLVYLVNIIEDVFLIYTGMNSLRWDIETYADLMTISDSSQKETFYLDTSKFTANHFNQMVPYIEASILRNYVFSQKEYGHTDIQAILDSFNLQHFLKSVNVDPRVLILQPEGTFSQLSREGTTMVADYFNSPSYDIQRFKYYTAVEAAEKLVFNYREKLKFGSIRQGDPDETLNLMKSIAKALVYRAESYVCAPTVMHVVRVLQADGSKRNGETNCRDKRIKPNVAFCNIGRYGYLMSVYEQYGYIYRFHNTYCLPIKGHLNLTKCKNKLKKYLNRLNNGLDMLPSLTDLLPKTKEGGKKSMKKKRKRKKRRFTTRKR